MRKILFIFLIIFPFAIISAQDTNYSFFHLGLAEYEYLFYFEEEKDVESTHNLTLNLLTGYSKNEYGLVIGVLNNIIENNAYGVQIAGICNRVRNQGKGLSVAGFSNNYNSHNGIQIALLNNHAEKMKGIQIGLTNSSVEMQGIQIGMVNGLEGLRTFKGLQIGMLNGMLNGFEGLQTLKGVQIGIMNMAKTGGFQIGLCNVSDNNQYPLGLINIVKNGEMNAGLTYDEIGNITAQFRSGGRHLYGIIGLGYNTRSLNSHGVFQGGIGMHLNLLSDFRINTEISATYLSRNYTYYGEKTEEVERKIKEFDYKPANKYTFGIFPSVKIAGKIELFGGPTLNYLETNTLDNIRIFPSKYIWQDFNSTSLKQVHIGYSFGANYIF